MHAANMTVASKTPPSERRPCPARRHQAHRPEAGRNDKSEGLVNAATPHSRPKPSHGLSSSASSITSVSQKIKASNKAARLVSHTQRVHQKMTEGNSTQVQAVHTATFSLKQRLPIRKMGTHVNPEHMLLMLSRTNADPRL